MKCHRYTYRARHLARGGAEEVRRLCAEPRGPELPRLLLEAASAAEARMGRGGEEDGGGYLWGSEERDHSSDIGKAQITRSLISLHATRKFLASQNSSFTTAALLRSQT